MPSLFPPRRYSMATLPGVTPTAPPKDQYDPLQIGQRRRRRGLFGGPARGIVRREDGDPGTLLNYALFGQGGVETMRDRAEHRELFPLGVRREKLEQSQIERELNAPPEAPDVSVTQSGTFWRQGANGLPEIVGRDPNWQPPAAMIYQPPAGYRGTAETGLEPIPGGPADVRATAEGRSRMQQMDSSARQLGNAISVLDEALPQVDWDSTGLVGQTMRGIGGTDAYNLNQALEPVRAILSFENLAEMRRNSQTGGALGSIAVRELELLGNTVRSLDTAQSTQQMRRALQATRAQLARTLQAIQAARQEMDQGPGEAPAESYVQDAPTNDGSAPEQPRVRRWNPATGRLE